MKPYIWGILGLCTGVGLLVVAGIRIEVGASWRLTEAIFTPAAIVFSAGLIALAIASKK